MILSRQLWERSGHWDHYQENMYFLKIDEDDYAVKPMNCPGGIICYKTRPHSYREFPIRYGELGLVHRHERSGVLHGLMRVRCFTQDDAHIFMLPEQITDEIIKVIDLIDHHLQDLRLSLPGGAVDQTGERHGLRRDLGPGHRCPEAGPGAEGARLPGERGGWRLLRPQDRLPSVRTPWAGTGSAARSSWTSRCPSASTSPTSGRMARSTAR